MVKGDKKNFLTMVSDARRGTNKYNSRALFQCDCGKVKDIIIHSVVTGQTKSCGCLQRAYAKTRSYKHGDTRQRLYRIWNDMKSRCLNKNASDYSRYGDRGICICDEWRNDYISFRNWALKNGYASNLSIDRIDTNKGYSPENCRWATNKEQSRNRRSNIVINIDGNHMCLMEWCETHGLPYGTIQMRIQRGWDVTDAITKPIKGAKHD